VKLIRPLQTLVVRAQKDKTAACLLPAVLVVSALALVLAAFSACGQPRDKETHSTGTLIHTLSTPSSLPSGDRLLQAEQRSSPAACAVSEAQDQSLHERLRRELAATGFQYCVGQDTSNTGCLDEANAQMEDPKAGPHDMRLAGSSYVLQGGTAGTRPEAIQPVTALADYAFVPMGALSAQRTTQPIPSVEASGSQQPSSVQTKPAQSARWQELRQEPATTTTTVLEITNYAVVGPDPDSDQYPNKFVIESDDTSQIEEGVPGPQNRPTWKSYLMQFSYKDERPTDPETPPHLKYYRWTDLYGHEYSTFPSNKAGDDIKHIIISGSPGADTFAPGGIDIFVCSTKNELQWGVIWHQGAKPWLLGERLGDGSWGKENSGLEAGPAQNCRPASVSWGGETHVFVRGADNALYWRRGADTWYDWINLGGLLTSDPACASSQPGEIHLFVRGPQGHLYYRVLRNGNWSPWQDLGGNLASGPAATVRSDHQLDVFARGADGKLWWISRGRSGGWSPWTCLGGQLTSAPAAVASEDSRIDVFARGTNGTLWSLTWLRDSGWLPWQDHGGMPILSSPTAVSWAPNRIDVFVRGAFIDGKGNALYHTWWDGTTWLP